MQGWSASSARANAPAAAAGPGDEATAFLLNQPAGRAERRRALAVLLVSLVLFCVVAPQAKLKLPAVVAFMPIYESALVIIDLITAVLLFGQYRILRSPALLLLGSGYLFSLLLTVGHGLTFPGMFTPTGLLGAGPQSTAWIYMFWHSGFPLFVLGYALLKRAAPLPSPAYGRMALAVPLLATLVALGLIALATAGQAALPAIMSGNQYTAAMRGTVASVWLFSLVALLVLSRQRPYTVLDLWLVVVLSAWLFDIALSAMFNGGRYDLGFYAGRIFGLLACGVVLLELLLENGMLYARLVQAHQDEHRKSVELAAARDAAQAATAAKSLFLASMSHEIRTPMNAIIGLTHLVLETDLRARQRDLLSKVQTSSRALLTLLNDILDYSKIEAGKVVLEREEFSPEETIENVGHLFSARIEEAGLELFFEIGEDIPQRLCGDALRLTQVLNNLVGNAIKFTARGEIVIGAELVSRSETQIQIQFSVRDTGIGLPKAQAERLFQAFEQADSSVTRRYGGTGLGLAICKRLVVLMGGDIWVRSTPGEGSCFSFTANFEPASEAAERIDLHRIHGMRTLIVDSQPTARLILQQILQSWRFQVGTASFTDDALLKLRRTDRRAPYELLLLDWKTAGLELVQQARQIAGEHGGRPLAVLIMVGAQQREQMLEEIDGDAAGIGIVLKPVTHSRLFEAVLELQHGQTAPPPAQGIGESSFAELLRPLRGARVLLAEDNLVNQQVACAFLELGGLEVTVANNGEEAVDWIKRAAFDIVLMDMQMPDMDGIQATRVIRSLPQAARLPIIAMTAAALDEDKQECLAAGMNAHVSKPIDPRQLARTLLDWVPPLDHDQQDRAGGR
ncbi:response regulator [Paucibacter sp. M5-1]|uniref:response regulator n=1 Tax=Paucibacter sp. M5-1 TaxID=3015998 RepID=UPI0022B925EF|nr:response regulator [Paucibacter sp. M5-1]MCZ7882760.1 response regulator [Paucibacter sp. M5-1]